MNLELVEKIADAVLYEGYMLYPYRASSVKNRQRFNWGALAPESYSAAQKGTEAFEMQTECLLQGDENTTFDVKVRFLHLVSREVGELKNPLDELSADSEPDFQLVPSLDVGGRLYQTWQEAIEREVDLPTLRLNQVSEIKKFTFPTTRTLEPLRDENEKIVGVIVRTQQEIFGVIELQVRTVCGSGRLNAENTNAENNLNATTDKLQPSATADGSDSSKNVYKLTVKIKNQTAFEDANEQSRDDALMHSLVSTHTILSAKKGEFISLLEPPNELSEAVAGCENVKTYPVLAGNEGEKDCVLSSPIILYDYPQIAEESQGDLFDGAEIDEILTLRIMTLTDDEKREMRNIDDRARKILERTETMPEEYLMRMHGAMKSVGKSAKENK
ncbi:MAG: hypothetical protein ACR2F2_02085 [Pyrinomonadaceae bacterium]